MRKSWSTTAHAWCMYCQHMSRVAIAWIDKYRDELTHEVMGRSQEG